MSYSKKYFGKGVNNKCLISETRTLLQTSQTAGREGKWTMIKMMIMMMMMMTIS